MFEDPFTDDPDEGGGTVVAPTKEAVEEQDVDHIPRYHVLLWDSDDHSYGYVERMLRELFGYKPERCHKLACTVDEQGKAVVITTTQEHAELKRDQIHAYGDDESMGTTGSMWATIEKAD